MSLPICCCLQTLRLKIHVVTREKIYPAELGLLPYVWWVNIPSHAQSGGIGGPVLRSEIYERENEEILPSTILIVWHWYLKHAPSVRCAYLQASVNCDENVVTDTGRNPNANIEDEGPLKLSPLSMLWTKTSLGQFVGSFKTEMPMYTCQISVGCVATTLMTLFYSSWILF